MALWYNSTLNAVKGLKMALVRSGRVSRCRLWSVWWCLCLWCGVCECLCGSSGLWCCLVWVWSLLCLCGSSGVLWWCCVLLCCLWSGVGSSLVVCLSVSVVVWSSLWVSSLVWWCGVSGGLLFWCLVFWWCWVWWYK